ncbi:hypothetical protein JTB14_007205 [Gonioctena quinquepunctata]|nr:hypothetical protein JTB14_007205 [Gonioctena quinquepunctata]
MLRAIEAVKNHGMCFKTASRNYNVPRTTLKRRVLNVNKDALKKYRVLIDQYLTKIKKKKYFRKTGIYPYDIEFAPSLTTDMLHVDGETGSLERNAEVLDPDEITNACSPQDGTSANEQQIPRNHILDNQISIAFFASSIALCCASVIPTVEVLQGPSSRTTLFGPDGGALDSAAPGGTVVTNSHGTGLVAAGPAILPSGPALVINGPAGSIATSHTGSGLAVVPGVAPAIAAAAAWGPASQDGGAYVSDNSGSWGDDGSYREGHQWD